MLKLVKANLGNSSVKTHIFQNVLKYWENSIGVPVVSVSCCVCPYMSFPTGCAQDTAFVSTQYLRDGGASPVLCCSIYDLPCKPTSLPGPKFGKKADTLEKSLWQGNNSQLRDLQASTRASWGNRQQEAGALDLTARKLFNRARNRFFQNGRIKCILTNFLIWPLRILDQSIQMAMVHKNYDL